MLERVDLQAWTGSRSSTTSLHCSLTVGAKVPAHRPFISNGLQKRGTGRSVSDAAILYSLRDYLNDLDSALEAAHYFSDSEVGLKSSTSSSSTTKASPVSKEDPGKRLFSVSSLFNDEKLSAEEDVSFPREEEKKTETGEDEKVDKASSVRPPKKRVRFADDNGFELTMVKIIEDSFVAAMFEAVFDQDYSIYVSTSPNPQLQHQPQSLVSTPFSHMNYRWVIEFCIPSRQYALFRDRVNTQMVSLENIHVDDEGPGCLRGSIKVKNIAYHKRVFLRVTYDRWGSWEDLPATHQPSREPNPRFDAFVFRVPLKRPVLVGERLEFAVCFQTDREEFWDSNNGENYLLTSHTFSQTQMQILGGRGYPQAQQNAHQGMSSTEMGSTQRASSLLRSCAVDVSRYTTLSSHGCLTDFRIWDQTTETTYY